MTKKKSDPQKPIGDKNNVKRQPSAEKPQEELSMSDGEYIRTRVTEDMLQDPNEPGINPLDKAARQLEAKFSGAVNRSIVRGDAPARSLLFR